MTNQNPTFDYVNDACADKRGNVYCVGFLSLGKNALWSYDADLRLRWVQPLPRAYDALARSKDSIVAWQRSLNDSACFSTEDGRNRPPLSFEGSPLANRRLRKLLWDADGTFLSVCSEEDRPHRIERWTERFASKAHLPRERPLRFSLVRGRLGKLCRGSDSSRRRPYRLPRALRPLRCQAADARSM